MAGFLHSMKLTDPLITRNIRIIVTFFQILCNILSSSADIYAVTLKYVNGRYPDNATTDNQRTDVIS